MKHALIIFVRHPEPGKVKTRIGAVAGHEVALAIYDKLLQHTQEITAALAADKFVYYADALADNDLWSKRQYKKARQEGTDLGERMRNAFTTVFSKGYEKVCIIGSDCYELTTALLERAYEELDAADIVIGPAKDGGYYLLGMKGGVKDVFKHIEWSTGKVLQQTIQLIAPKHQYTLLPCLRDVDTLEDVPTEWLHLH